MISCKTLIHASHTLKHRFIHKHRDEGPVCFQLSGNDPNDLGEAVKIASDHGADLIDLNCGCPVNKIRSKGAGSSLLTNASKLYQLIKAMKENTNVPVSIKIRVEGGGVERFHEDVASAVEDAGADYLIVHGRHWTEHYETACRHEQIQYFVERLKIPVIGNGDVSSIETLQKMLATGCAGAMIGRAGVGQPWLIAKLTAELQNQVFVPPANHEIGAMYVQHVEGLIELLEDSRFAIIQSRKFAKYYARTLSNKLEFCEKMHGVEDFNTFKTLCQRYFGS